MVVVVKGKGPKPKRKGGKKQPRRMNPVKELTMLHPCTLKYLKAITDPFNPDAYGACVPIDNMYPSQKYHSFSRGICTIGTGGVGMILISPCLANDIPGIYKTTSLYAGVDTQTINLGLAAFIGAFDTINLITPYTQSQMTDQGVAGTPALVKGRIVGAGIQWWYNGTELERSGYSASFTSQYHDTLEGYSAADIISRPTVNVRPNESRRSKHRECIFAIRNSELVYPITYPGAASSADQVSNCYPFCSNKATSIASANGAPITVVMFFGEPGTSYGYEYGQHSEFIGRPCDFAANKNAADPEGVAVVQESIAKVANDSRKETTFQNVIRTIAETSDETRRNMVKIGAHLYKGMKEYQSYSRGSGRLMLGDAPRSAY